MNALTSIRCLAALTLLGFGSIASAARPNILIVTVDDMSADSLGAFGCELADTSPHIDQFAKTAMKFEHAHCLVGNCMPGRNIMWSGLYSHVNGVEGFQQNKQPSYPVLCDLAKDAGYLAGIRGKVSHSTPYTPYPWSTVLDEASDGKKYHIKDVDSYGQSTADGIRMAKEAGKPFCLMVNISDPHKPFYSGPKDKNQPSRVFTKDEVPVPGFLPDDEVIRTELALYYSSVRRADDAFGKVMQALEESGQSDNTFVMFLSDHGMPLPFAKTQLYHHSTHTPLLVRWPSVTKPGALDDKHMVSAIDFLPTLLEVMEQKHPNPETLHGRSFASILRGETQEDRDFIVLQYNENAGRNRHPMRGIQTKQMLYLYNPWSDGNRKFATATTGTATYRQMVKRAPTESDVAERLDLFDHRVVEELYEVQHDPDCLVNLIESPAKQQVLAEMRSRLASRLTDLNDPVAPLASAHEDVALREEYMAAEDEKTQRARSNRSKKNKTQNSKDGKKQKTSGKGEAKRRKVISLNPPTKVPMNGELTVSIHHELPADLGEQKLHVTLKDGAGTRLHRSVVTITGNGDAKVKFNVPDVDAIKISAFVGEAYDSNIQHITSDAFTTAK